MNISPNEHKCHHFRELTEHILESFDMVLYLNFAADV